VLIPFATSLKGRIDIQGVLEGGDLEPDAAGLGSWKVAFDTLFRPDNLVTGLTNFTVAAQGSELWHSVH
jgi:hypothetical protein